MYSNFEVLKSKCIRYRLKKILKILMYIFVGCFVIVAILFLDKLENTDIYKSIIKNTQNEKIEIKIPEKIEVIKTETIISKKLEVIEKEIKKIEIEKNKKYIKKDVEYNLDIDANYKVKEENKVIKKTKKTKLIKKLKKVRKKQFEKVIQPKIVHKPLIITLKKVESTDEMIKLYNKENKYYLALKIAKLFYKNQNYSKALLWSKKANQLNIKAEAAWIIYAKSEYARGNQKRAIEILKIYTAKAISKEARFLLSSWLKEK